MTHHKLFYLRKKHVGVADWGLLSFGLFDEVDFVQVGETRTMGTHALCLGGILWKRNLEIQSEKPMQTCLLQKGQPKTEEWRTMTPKVS